MSNITNDRLGYEAMSGLGDSTDLSSWIANDAPIPQYNLSPTDYFYMPPSSGGGFDWTSLIAPIEKTGLQIASNVTNPAYNTPGSYTRLADGTVIATAGTAQTGYGSAAGGMNLSSFGSGGSLMPLLLIGGAIVAVMALAGGKH